MNVSDPRVSIVVPCYNERDNISDCINQLEEALRSAQIPFEIILVNDGSIDDTLEQARSLAVSRSFLRVVDLGGNFGKTVALREGVRLAKGNKVAFFDADLQYAPEDLVMMITKLKDGIDFINGSRDYNGYGASRTTFSRLYNQVVRFLFRTDLRDSNCGVKVIRREAADANTIFSYGLPLIVPLLKIRGFESTEVPVALHDRKTGESKYFQDGEFLGGTRNMRDIVFHSIMLLNLLAHVPLEWGSKDRGSEEAPKSQR